jgi:hypothetical protein
MTRIHLHRNKKYLPRKRNYDYYSDDASDEYDSDDNDNNDKDDFDDFDNFDNKKRKPDENSDIIDMEIDMEIDSDDIHIVDQKMDSSRYVEMMHDIILYKKTLLNEIKVLKEAMIQLELKLLPII